MGRRWTGIGAAVAAGLLLATGARGADEAEVAKTTYLRYCGACHGPGGKGDGIAGTFMRPKPTDLTQIAKRNGGKFPFEPVLRKIDGRDDVRAHGDPEMPVWGEIFAREVPSSASPHAPVQGKLLLITTHLQSIQEK
jgi:hypothetical protein